MNEPGKPSLPSRAPRSVISQTYLVKGSFNVSQ
jgi:hypothetical protein